MKPFTVNFKNTDVLNACYISFAKTGGFFLPAPNQTNDLKPNEQILLTFTLPDNPNKIEKAMGKIMWITPGETFHGALEGLGIVFDNNEENQNLKIRIENLLVGKEKLDNQLFFTK